MYVEKRKKGPKPSSFPEGEWNPSCTARTSGKKISCRRHEGEEAAVKKKKERGKGLKDTRGKKSFEDSGVPGFQRTLLSAGMPVKKRGTNESGSKNNKPGLRGAAPLILTPLNIFAEGEWGQLRP